MEQVVIELTPEMLALVPVVAAIIQVLKKIPAIAKIKGWLPFVSVGISLGLGYIAQVPDPVLSAVIIGLVAVGGYEIVKGR